jgi:hypothetical protein
MEVSHNITPPPLLNLNVSDLVNRGTSTARGAHQPVRLVAYKRGSKAKEKEREGQAAPLEDIYDLRVT